MTVLIHGTLSRAEERGPTLDYFWYKPRSRFQRYVRQQGIFTDVYDHQDYFHWPGWPTYEARQQGAEQLVDWCRSRPAAYRRLVCHSHGCNVANLALGLGLQVDELVLLSPPVPPAGHPCQVNYLPVVANIRRGCFSVVFSQTDGIIGNIEQNDWRKEYSGTPVESFQAAKMLCNPSNHWSSVDRDLWDSAGVPAWLTAGCPQPLLDCDLS